MPRFLDLFDLDFFLVALRYTLMEHDTLDSRAALLRAARCRHHHRRRVLAPGVTATGAVPGAKYNYADATPEVMDKVRRIEAVCERHDVPLQAAALQFPFGHPSVASVIPGAIRPDQVAGQSRLISATPIPTAFWQELQHERLIRAGRAGAGSLRQRSPPWPRSRASRSTSSATRCRTSSCPRMAPPASAISCRQGRPDALHPLCRHHRHRRRGARRVRDPLGRHARDVRPGADAGAPSARPRPGCTRGDLRRPQARGARLRPHGPRPARHRALGSRRQAPRHLGRHACSAASARGCRPMPAPITARTSPAASTRPRPSPTTRWPARSAASPASRSMAGTTATRSARPRTCWASARRSATTGR